MAKNTKKDQIIIQLKSKIEEKRKFVEKSEKPLWKSTMIIDIMGAPTINIHTLNEDTAIYALASLIQYKNALLQAIMLIPGCTKTVEKVDNWIADVLTKLQVVTKNNLVASLKKDEAELEELLSDDYKKDKKLESIAKKYDI